MFKVRYDDFALYIFLIAILYDGILFEIIGCTALLYLIYFQAKCGAENYYYYKDRKFCLFVIVLVIGYVIIQIGLLKLATANIVKLYGITKTVFALPIVYIAIGSSVIADDKVGKILPFVIIINIIQLIYKISGIEILNILKGSLNYIGAIDILFLPYVLKFGNIENRIQRHLFLFLFFLQLFVSGSRSVLLIAVIMVFFLIIAEKNLKKKFVYSLSFLFAIIIICYLSSTNGYLNRAINVFRDRSDAARTGLVKFAKQQYESYSPLEKLIGNGDVMVLSQMKPVHNFLWELLICYGKIGLCMWSVYMFFLVIMCVFRELKNKYYLFLLIGCTFLVGYVQPFLTTGFLYQTLFSIIILQIYSSSIQES